MDWKNSWEAFFGGIVANNKDESFLKSLHNLEIKEIGYQGLEEVVELLKDLPYSKAIIAVKAFNKHIKKSDVILAILINIISSGNRSLEEFIFSDVFPEYGLSLFPRLLKIAQGVEEDVFWQKIEKYLEYFKFYDRTDKYFKWQDKHIIRYLVNIIASIPTVKNQWLLFKVLEEVSYLPLQKHIVNLLGNNFRNKSTLDKLLEIYKDGNSALDKEIKRILLIFPLEELFSFIGYLTNKDNLLSKRKLLIDVLLEKASQINNFQPLLLTAMSFSEELKVYFFRKFSYILKKFLEEADKLSLEEKTKFLESHYYIVDFLLINLSHLKDINFTLWIKFIFAFEKVREKIEDVYQLLDEEAKIEFIEVLCSKDEIELLARLEKEIIKMESPEALDKLVVYLSTKLNKLAVKILIKLMLHPNEKVREKVKKVLKNEDLKKEISVYLGDFDPEIRLAIVRLLADKNDLFVFSKLSQLVKDPSPHVRKEVLHVLYDMDPKRAFPFLVESLKDTNEIIVQTSLDLLKQYEEREISIIPILIDLLTHHSPKIRVKVSEELVKRIWFDYAVRGLEKNSSFYHEIVGKCFKIKPEVIAFLKDYLKDENYQLRRKAINFLDTIITPDIFNYFLEDLYGSLSDPDIEVVKTVLKFFKHSTDFKLIEDVYLLLSKPYRLDVFEVILELSQEWKGKLGKDFIIFLYKLKDKSKEDIYLRSYLMVVLLKLGEMQFFQQLVQQIISENYLERSAAIEAFGAVTSGDKVKIVFSALQDSSPQVRLSALKVLLHLKNKKRTGQEVYKNFKYIKPLLKDKNKDVRDVSEKLLSD